MRRLNLTSIFTLSWRKLALLLLLELVFIILHNAVFALTGLEEAFFFILAVFIIPLHLLISLLYTSFRKLT